MGDIAVLIFIADNMCFDCMLNGQWHNIKVMLLDVYSFFTVSLICLRLMRLRFELVHDIARVTNNFDWLIDWLLPCHIFDAVMRPVSALTEVSLYLWSDLTYSLRLRGRWPMLHRAHRSRRVLLLRLLLWFLSYVFCHPSRPMLLSRLSGLWAISQVYRPTSYMDFYCMSLC